MNDLKRYIERFGILGLLRFAFYPLTHLLANPIILTISLLKSLSQFSIHGIKRFQHFNLTPALVSYFYSIRAWNLKKYGRRGKTDYLGLGEYYLARCFNYSKFSLYTYWKAGAFTVFIGMLLYACAFLFVSQKDLHFYLCLYLGITSSLFFANLFRSQNYNVIGWIFFPIVLIGLMEDLPFLVAFSLLLASYGSFTVVVFGILFSGIWGLIQVDWLMMFAGLPALLKLLTHFHPFLKIDKKLGLEILNKVLKAIGANEKAKYHRKKTKALNLFKLYFIVLDILFIASYAFIVNDFPYLYTVYFGIYLINSLKFRIADDQSLHMLRLTVALITVIYAQNYYLLISLWLVISPLPLMIGYYQMRVLDLLPISQPLNLRVMESRFEQFFEEVEKGSKVLMACEDPDSKYENVFQGFRHLIELPIYVAMLKGIRLFPDWWAVFELNYEGATEIWGTQSMEVERNMKEWNCRYVISYDWDKKEIDPLLNDSNFEKIAELDWSEFDSLFKDYPKLKKKDLKWYLLKKLN
ncbi:MAG: hypothetical protein AAF487_03530 [Bacteroidota bacterium]